MIILGIILLVIGFIAKIAILWSIGIIVGGQVPNLTRLAG